MPDTLRPYRRVMWKNDSLPGVGERHDPACQGCSFVVPARVGDDTELHVGFLLDGDLHLLRSQSPAGSAVQDVVAIR